MFSEANIIICNAFVTFSF